MPIYLLAFLLGFVSGLRAFMGIVAVSWAAHLRWLHLENTKLAILGFAATPYVLTVAELGELVNDKLPKTPSRTIPVAFAARVILGMLCGAAVALPNGELLIGLIAGAVGAVAGTLGGARGRAMLARAFGKDLPAALLEDLIAISLAFFVVSR